MTAATSDGADITVGLFGRVDLRRATWRAIDFGDTRIKKTNFTGTNMEAVVLTSAVFCITNLSGANLSAAVGLTAKQLDNACGNPATILPEGLMIGACD